MNVDRGKIKYRVDKYTVCLKCNTARELQKAKFFGGREGGGGGGTAEPPCMNKIAPSVLVSTLIISSSYAPSTEMLYRALI